MKLLSPKITIFILIILLLFSSCENTAIPVINESTDSISISNDISEVASQEEIETSINDTSEASNVVSEISELPDSNYFSLLSAYADSLDDFTKTHLSEEFTDWIINNYGISSIEAVLSELEKASYNKELWHTLTGSTITVLYDLYTDAANTQNNIIVKQDNGDEFTSLVFTGDISLADTWYNIKDLVEKNKTITDYIDSKYVDELNNADITLVNNEFTVSSRGEPLEYKKYILRAEPSRLSMYEALGVDIVSLANNHVYDYGKDAFLDMLQYLNEAKIPYIGAGKNLDEAITPQYYIINGRKIALVAANRSEKLVLTPGADENSPGVLRCYDTELFKEVIRNAKQNADIVFAYVHWGTELSHSFDEVQQSQGYEYIDAGADAVIGSHAHCLQGVEYYNGRPIIYNLGNFWFSGSTEELGVLKVSISNEGKIDYQMLLGKEDKFNTVFAVGTTKTSELQFLRSISANVVIGENGYLIEVDEPQNTYSFESNITDTEILNKLQELSEFVEKYNNISIYYENASGNYYSYKTDTKYLTASTIKGPFSLYILKKADKGDVDFNTKLALQSSQIWRGGGVIKDSPVGTEYTIKELIEYAIIESDNTAYKMLVDYFGVVEFNQYVHSKGINLQLIEGNGYGYCTAKEMATLYLEIYNYQGQNSEFLIDCLLKSKYDKQIQSGITEYNVAQKYGNQGGNNGFHDVAIVYAPMPFVLSIFTSIDANSNNSTEPFVHIAEIINALNKDL